MEALLVYADSDSEEESVKPAQPGTGSEIQEVATADGIQHGLNQVKSEDYFRLYHSSDEDEDSLCSSLKNPMEEGNRVHLNMTDTLMKAYQLREDAVGPPMPEFEVAGAEVRNGGSQVCRRRRSPVRRTYDTPSGTKCCKIATNKRQERSDDIPVMEMVEEPREKQLFTLGVSLGCDQGMFQPHPTVVPYLDNSSDCSATMKYSRLSRHAHYPPLRGHSGCVNTLQWGRPNKHSHLLLSASMDGTVRIWDGVSPTYKCLWSKKVHQSSAIRCAQWSSDCSLVASGGYDKQARVTDVQQERELIACSHDHFVQCLKFHPKHPQMFLTGTLGRLECWDIREKGIKPAKSFIADFGEVQDIAFLLNSEVFLSCTNLANRESSEKAIMAWDFRTGAILSNQIFQERYHCTCLRIHPDTKWFVAQTNGNYIALFSTARPYKMNKFKRFEGHRVEGYWIGCDFSADGRFVYSGSADGHLYIYNFHNSTLLRKFRVSSAPCLAVECHPVLPGVVAVSDWNGKIHICR